MQQNYIPITNNEIFQLRMARQIFADCYLVATLNSFTRTVDGQKYLKQNIQKTNTGNSTEFKIHFPDIYGKPQDVFVTEKEIDLLQLTDRNCNTIYHGVSENKTLKAVEVAMNKLIAKYPMLKDIFNRLPNCVENFEYNSPSRFMRMFTGRTPVSLNENSLRLTLKSKKEETEELFKQIKKENGGHNFIAGTAYAGHQSLENWHCYVIREIDANNSLDLYNPRTSEKFKLSFNTFIKNFKFMTGFLSKQLR